MNFNTPTDMNKTLKFIAAVLVLGIATAFAQDQQQQIMTKAYRFWSGGSTNAGTLSWVIVGANSDNGGTPVIKQINANTDKAGAQLKFYEVTGQALVTHTNATVTIPVVATNNVFSASGVIIIRHKRNDTYVKRILTTSTGATNLVCTVTPDIAVVPGDIIYGARAADAGYMLIPTNTIVAGNNILTVYGEQLYTGQPGLPLLIELDGTTTANINSVSARFEP